MAAIKRVAWSPRCRSMEHTRWPSPAARCRLDTHIPHGPVSRSQPLAETRRVRHPGGLGEVSGFFGGQSSTQEGAQCHLEPSHTPHTRARITLVYLLRSCLLTHALTYSLHRSPLCLCGGLAGFLRCVAAVCALSAHEKMWPHTSGREGRFGVF